MYGRFLPNKSVIDLGLEHALLQTLLSIFAKQDRGRIRNCKLEWPEHANGCGETCAKRVRMGCGPNNFTSTLGLMR